jgi:molybdopterin converting factor small subunit
MNSLQRNCVDKLPLQSIIMAEQDNSVTVCVVAFGPLSEEIQRRQEIQLAKNSTIRDLINTMNLEKWLENGLTVAINGDICDIEKVLSNNDEIALLPPVSGG